MKIDPSTPEELRRRLEIIVRWYRGMIDGETGRLVYLYDPESDTAKMDSSPIRDIASIWDVEILSEFLGNRDLLPFIKKRLEHYGGSITNLHGLTLLDEALLAEPSCIAHSAFMALSLLHSHLPGSLEKAIPLVEGILAQQRDDGSYKIYFGDRPDEGLDFYPGEAMLALMETYRIGGDERFLKSTELGFNYYRSEYYMKGRVLPDLMVFFANWQSQYCRLLFESTSRADLKKTVKGYVLELHERIADGFYEKVKRHPSGQSVVEVACALEGLNEGYAIACQDGDERSKETYRRSICICLAYLLAAQCTEVCTKRERGGFGMTFANRLQRIDVTGHAMSGFVKSLNNGVVC